MSPITLRVCRESDVPAVVALNVSAFQHSAYQQALWPSKLRIKPGQQDILDWTEQRMRRSLDDPGVHFVVAVDSPIPAGEETEGEKVVGFAEWIGPATLPAAKEEPDSQASTAQTAKREPPASLDQDAARKGSDEIRTLLSSEEVVSAFQGRDMKNMWTLNSIAVDPEYRGRGIGEKLTHWGVHEAHEAQRDIWLISAPSGRPLYLRTGFKEIAQGSRFGEDQYVMTMFRDETVDTTQR